MNHHWIPRIAQYMLVFVSTGTQNVWHIYGYYILFYLWYAVSEGKNAIYILLIQYLSNIG